jgi:hypothetical protein
MWKGFEGMSRRSGQRLVRLSTPFINETHMMSLYLVKSSFILLSFTKLQIKIFENRCSTYNFRWNINGSDESNNELIRYELLGNEPTPSSHGAYHSLIYHCLECCAGSISAAQLLELIGTESADDDGR